MFIPLESGVKYRAVINFSDDDQQTDFMAAVVYLYLGDGAVEITRITELELAGIYLAGVSKNIEGIFWDWKDDRSRPLLEAMLEKYSDEIQTAVIKQLTAEGAIR